MVRVFLDLAGTDKLFPFPYAWHRDFGALNTLEEAYKHNAESNHQYTNVS